MPTYIILIVSFYFPYSPQTDYDTVKHIEAVVHVLEEAQRCEFEHHLDGEDAAEDEIAELEDAGEPGRLVVVLDSHTEGVEEDTHSDPLQHSRVTAAQNTSGNLSEHAVSDHLLQVAAHCGEGQLQLQPSKPQEPAAYSLSAKQ